MLDVEVIEDPGVAAIVVEPMKSRLLAALVEPASAATLAGRLGLPRQKVNYHLRSLEDYGLARVWEERTWGGLTERVKRSATYLIALATRIVGEVSALMRRANDANKRLPTLSVDTEIRFRSPADRAAFTRELTEAVTTLVARYHDAAAPGGRPHRLVIVSHPLPLDPQS